METNNDKCYLLQIGDYYYIGRTHIIDKRIQQHVNGEGCAWTRWLIHKFNAKPVILKIWNDCDGFDEDKYTKICMKEKGIKYVRGGSYCNIVLEESQIDNINRELCTVDNKCFKCSTKGHIAVNCHRDRNSMNKTNIHCYYCNNTGHLIDECYSKINDISNIIDKCNICDSIDHNADECVMNNKPCHRCGRLGHWAPNCYANTHKNGRKLF